MRREGPLHVGVGDSVADDRFRGFAFERTPSVAIHLARSLQIARRLKGCERARQIRSRIAVDFAWREAIAIQEDLEPQCIAAGGRFLSGGLSGRMLFRL